MNNYVERIFDKNTDKVNACAIVDRNGQRQTTWKQLREGAYKVAAYATKRKRSGLIPIFMPRCTETVISMLGLALAGLGIAPLSDHTPKTRLELIEAQAQNRAWGMEDYEEAMREEAAPFDAVPFADDAAAYVVFTSGSTGMPKGVILRNGTVEKAYIRLSGANCFDLQDGDAMLQTASFSFIVLMSGLYAPLYSGCVTHILPDAARLDMELMTAYINTHGITSMFITPKPLSRLGQTHSLRVVCVGGERVTQLGAKGYRLLNAWGMSETAAIAMGYEIPAPMDKTPIGKPLEGFRAYILDEDGNLSDEGELCISGDIANGYWNRPDLTEKTFVPNPFSQEPGHETLLHTGDLVRRLEDGDLLYLDRKDFMIKINGQRVEPGEAEAVLEHMEGIRAAAVKGFTEEDGRTYLCAYYVSDENLSEQLLRETLQKQLPNYMVPAFYVKLDALPLNANGKLDRKALPKPAAGKGQGSYEAASNATEETLCSAFAAVLGLERVGATDDFLMLGGDSIRAMSVVAAAGIQGLRGFDILAGRTPREIARHISQEEDASCENLPNGLNRVPLTDSQMGVHLECAEHPESTMYNIPVHLSIPRGTLTCRRVKEAIDMVIAAHPALYARTETENGSVYMVRMPMPEGGICTVKEENEEAVSAALQNPAAPFDLSKSPLCRVTALLTKDAIHILMDLHHVVSDGTSVSLLVRQICDAIAGKEIPKETIDAFSLYEVQTRQQEKLPAARAYFEALLSGTETDSNLLFDKKSDNHGVIPAKRLTICLGQLPLDDVKTAGITEASFFMGVYGYALAKMTGQASSLFTAGESGRKSAKLNETVSMMVRTLPVVMTLDEKQTAFALLHQVQSQFVASQEHDICSFGELARQYGVKSDVTFVYQSDMLADFESPAGFAAVEALANKDTFSNLSVSVLKQKTGFVLNIDYRSDCYLAATIERFAAVYKRIAAAFAENRTLSEISVLSAEDEAFLNALNETDSPYDLNETVLDLFRRSVKAYPDKVMVVCEDRKYTYAQADSITDRIAAFVQAKNIGRGQTVSVLVPRCEYMVLASLGIMKASAMYQPLDPSYPSERLCFMCKDAEAALLIADRALVHILEDYTGEILYTDEIPSLPDGKCTAASPRPEDGYVLLYTSGTTGTPKGCMLTHGNLTAFIHTYTRVTGIRADCRVGAYASYGFDAHMADMYPAIANAAEIHIIPEQIRLDLPALKAYLEKNLLTQMVMTTQLFRQFTAQYGSTKGMRCMVVGGEKLVEYTPNPNFRLINGYGPSECTVMATFFHVDKVYDDIPIGKALDNVKLYVVDAQGRRVPVGVPGELVIAGPQVGHGYLNRPEKTAEVFVPNTFEKMPGEAYQNCYKTGDIVRFLDDGNLYFIGRRDLQVKIRGFRIELSEVEKIIRQYPPIKDAAVIAADAPGGGKCIHAYLVSDETVDVEDLYRFIRENKPDYMVPAASMQIAAIPVTVNGKMDKRKLPKIELHFENTAKPETETQQRIFDKVAEVVGTNQFGIDTDIFMAGLSSLSSIRLCSLLAEEFDIPVQIRNLKKYNTVKKLEGFVQKSLGKTETAELTVETPVEEVRYAPDHPISKTMEGIFVECIRKPDSTFYNIPCLLKLSDQIDAERLKTALACAVEAHSYMKTELFTDKNGRVRQHLRLNDPFTAEKVKEISAESIASMQDSLVKPFAVTGSGLFEIALIHADGLYLLLNFHHIISDGTSMGLFLRDVEEAYLGRTPEPEAYSGFDSAEDEQTARAGEDLEDAKAYYENLLDGLDQNFLPAPDKLPTYLPDSGRFISTQKQASAENIRTFCAANKISMNAFFVSAFGLLLSRYAAMDYSVFNTVYNGRNDSRTTRTFAMLVKTLPVVCHADKTRVSELLADTSAQLMDSMANDLYSYAEISRDLGVKNDVMFIYQGDSFTQSTFCGLPAEECPLALSESKTAMAMQVMLKDGKLVYDFEYDPAKYTEKLISSMVSAFDTICAAFLREQELGKVSLLSDDALREMERFNDTEYEYDHSETITGLFLASAKKQPEHLCVSYQNKRLTYREVEALTGKTAKFLMERGIGTGDVVAILIHRDENMVITAHGVVRTGAAYVGLDPTYPGDRLAFMISDSGAKCLIADRGLMELLPDYHGAVLYTDEIEALPPLSAQEAEAYAQQPKYCVTPENDALIVYSSGTTGKPKGSVLQHKAIVCFYHNYILDAMLDETSHVATYASFGFDGGAMDVFSVPMRGASLFVIPDEIRLNLSSLEQFYVRNSITFGFMTTQVGCMFIASTKCRTLKRFMVGGEKLIPTTPPDWISFFNGYGPSETMCYVNRYRVLDAGSLQPIGIVSRNIREYIVDKFGNRQPFGACGELCISGGQLGRGYLNRPEKTAEVFVPNPFCTKAGYERMYRTGDMIRMLPDGNYDFVGRRDGQVKIRGFRIELSEVEGQIRKFPGVENAVVAAFDNPGGGKYLAAYVVMQTPLVQEELRSFIAKEKPEYMVPAVILQLDSIPLTSNGKVDMKKLPTAVASETAKGREPADETEETICRIFGEVLGRPKVYADDDFFAIGGSSISAIQVVVKCEQAGFSVVYKNLFANPTAQTLASFLHGTVSEDVRADDLETGDGHDYSALRANVIENLPGIRTNGVGDVLLTGATGFLGSHVLRELLDGTSGNVICIVRSKADMTAELRLQMMMVYYFEDWYTEELASRVTVIDGDIEEDETCEKLQALHFDTLINCAANVKHFAAGDELLGANFTGVENLIRLAEQKNAVLIQISSLSVGGESVNGSVPAGFVFRETDLNIGQSLENKYIYTKYLAEQAVIDAVSKKRIRGKIIRLGNLMARADDSEFQVNAGTNGFLRLFIGACALGCFPVGMMDSQVEFSPIDCVARAVVLLAGTPDKFTVFHAKNCNTIHYGYFVRALQSAGRRMEVVEDDVFEQKLNSALKEEDKVELLGGLLSYRNNVDSTLAAGADYTSTGNGGQADTRIKVSSGTDFTTKALYRLGFAWPLISEAYLEKMVNALIEMNFFTENEI